MVLKTVERLFSEDKGILSIELVNKQHVSTSFSRDTTCILLLQAVFQLLAFRHQSFCELYASYIVCEYSEMSGFLSQCASFQ